MLRAIIVLAQETAEDVAEKVEQLQVTPKPDELVWGSLAFLVLVVVLSKLAFPKLKQTMEERSRRIQGQLEDAERTRREADQVLEQYRQQLGDARAEVQRIIDEGKRTAEALRQELVQRAEREAQDIVGRARADVAGERDRAMVELRDTLADLSIQLASRVIEKDLSTSEAHRQLVDRAITELAGNGHRG